jgi:voltage-gated potassium channel
VSLGVAVLALSVQFDVFALPPHVRRVAEDAISVAFLGWILFVALREVFAPTTTERNAVLGALCGLMLILTVFTRLHGLLEVWAPGSYRGDGLAPEADKIAALATFQYFSTVTLTTLGFGDIVPASPMARLLSGVEAIAGQLYLAVVVASLVGRAARR